MADKRDNKFDEMLIGMLPKLRRYASYLTKDNIESEDLVNSVVLQCLEKHYQFTPGTDFSSWAVRIMYNTHISFTRRSARRTTYQLDENMANNDDPSNSQLILQLKAGLQQLPLSSRRIVVNIAIGESYLHVAEMEHLPVGTVRSRLSRGRAMLRELCDRESIR
jgi:RNA polymerase sigma-70 factor (ECF subfamily)